MNTKPLTDNSKKSKSKKKKEAIDVHLGNLAPIRVDDSHLSGSELADYADALAGARAALKDLEVTIKEAEGFLKSAMLRQYCDHYVATGRPPDLRRGIGRSGSFNVVQQRYVKISEGRADGLSSLGIDISKYKKTSYSMSLGKADDESIDRAIAALRSSLGDNYNEVVSENTVLDERFFGDLLENVRASLTDGERLDDKMMEVMRLLNPVIQFKEFETDLSSPEGFELAYEFSMISGDRNKAIKRSRRSSGK